MSNYKDRAYKAIADVSSERLFRPAFNDETNALLKTVSGALNLPKGQICLVVEWNSDPATPPLHRSGPLAGGPDWEHFEPNLGLTIRIAARASASREVKERIRYAGDALRFSV